MIIGVIKLALVSRHNSARAAVNRAGCDHRVLVIIPRRPGRQNALAVLIHNPIAVIRKRAAFNHQLQRCPRFWRQLVWRHNLQPIYFCGDGCWAGFWLCGGRWRRDRGGQLRQHSRCGREGRRSRGRGHGWQRGRGRNHAGERGRGRG